MPNKSVSSPGHRGGMTSLKSSSGQSEILIFLIFMIIASGAVMAYNSTNVSNGTDFITGHILNSSINETAGIAEPVMLVVESSKLIEIWAKTSLSLEALDNNGSYIISASLNLDDGSPLGGYEIKFYRDDVLIGQRITDSLGLAEITIEAAPGKHEITVEYAGDSGRFYLPSSGEMEIVSNESLSPSIKWISYDPESDTITITGDGVHCTPLMPCTLTDIYNADHQGGWNRIENLYNYSLLRLP
jgi:hypothetical protein